MKKILLVLLVLPLMATAQSLDRAKSLYERGLYRESAMELRPLAEGGDAEAQCMVAGMFFEGKGVDKNDQQGIKYATLSAEQGNADAVFLLADHYFDLGEFQKVYKTLDYYTKKFPAMLKQQPGAALAVCFMEGKGVEKDEERAWQILKETTLFEKAKQEYSQQYAAYLERHPEENVITYDVVEQMPSFPGGQAAMMQWIANNIKYPWLAEENGIQGNVICTCVIDTDGTVINVQVLRGVDPSLDKEAVRILEAMPKWIPGKHAGKPVRVKYTLPITFRLK